MRTKRFTVRAADTREIEGDFDRWVDARGLAGELVTAGATVVICDGSLFESDPADDGVVWRSEDPPRFEPGTRVRCAYRMAHEGTVLDPCDPDVWCGSVAFSSTYPAAPARAAVEAHVARLVAGGSRILEKVPVRWDFGVIYWDSQLEAV